MAIILVKDEISCFYMKVLIPMLRQPKWYKNITCLDILKEMKSKNVQNAIWWTNLQLPHINLSYCAALLITVVCEHMDTVIMNHQITLTYKHKIYKLHTEETCVCNQCWGIIIYLVNSYFFKPQWFWFLSSANKEIERSAEPCHTQIF